MKLSVSNIRLQRGFALIRDSNLIKKACIFGKYLQKNKKMPRSPLKKKRILLPDPVYNSKSVHMLVNRVLKSGKKSIAFRIVYTALLQIGETTNKNPLEVLLQALNNVTPRVQVKPRRRGGAIQMVPRLLPVGEKALTYAIRWILEACDKKSGQTMISKLKNEIIDAYKNTGYAMRKKEELHKIALSNAMYAKAPQKILSALSPETNTVSFSTQKRVKTQTKQINSVKK